MKKRIIAMALAALMICGLISSCGSGAGGTEGGQTAAADTVAADATTAEATTAAETGAEATDAATEEATTAAAELTAEQQFRTDNFAVGRMSQTLLDSVNQGVLALLADCMYFENTLQEGIKKGQKWVYSNSSTYVPQSGSFDSLVASGKYGTNCAMPQAWFFIDAGVVQNGKHIYGDSNGGFANFSSLGKYIGAVADITCWNGSVKFSSLYTNDKIEAGDIFLCKGHTFIYLGDEKFMAAGHDGDWHSDATANTDDSRNAVFDSWVCDMKSNSDYNYSIYWQIRLKDDYVPHYYRNAEGELVVNPCYDAATSIEYKQGVSPETPEVNYPGGEYAYDTSGKTNVLSGLTVTNTDGFNLGSIKNATYMTDGKLYYDNLETSYADIKLYAGNSYCINPLYWFDANGNRSSVKDDTHKYLCGIKYELSSAATLGSFSLYTQAVGASTGKPFGDIDGFDILVSADGVNWTVAYSVENATSQDKWSYTTEAFNKSAQGYQMCHYIRADFAQTYEAKYVMFALTQPRTQTEGKAQGTDYSLASTSAQYFRISEFQVYEAK